MYGGTDLKLAKNYINEKINKLPSNQNLPTNVLSFDNGIISIPPDVVNGQISDCRIKGLTVSQLVKNGNFANGTTAWTLTSSATLTSNNNILSITGKGTYGTNSAGQFLPSSIIGHKIFARALVRVTNADCTSLRLYIDASTSRYFRIISNPIQNQWYDSSGIVTSTTEDTNIRLYIMHDYADNITANGKVAEVKEVMLIDMTAEGLDALTVDEMKTKFPHWLKFGTKSTNSVALRSVNDDETKESIAYVNLPPGEVLRSLSNGVKDEISIGAGGAVKTKRISDDIPVSNTVYDSIDTETYTNVDVIKTTAFALAKAGTTGVDGQTRYYDKNGVELTEVAQADIDLEASVGKYYWHTDKTLWIIVAKGTYADIAAARTGLGATSLNYQLAQVQTTKLPPQTLEVYENGTVYVEPIGDPSLSTLPTVELTVPIGNSNNFGIATHSYAGAAADWVLSSSEAKCMMLIVTNAGGAANIIAPNRPGLYAVNNLSGQAITIKKSDGTGVVIANGKTAMVMHNGTDYTRLTADA